LEFFIRSEEEYAAAMNMNRQAFAIAIPVDWDSTPLIPFFSCPQICPICSRYAL
jgi:hypothetical protein